MPEKSTIRRVRKDASEGKAPTTQAGEFIREEIHHIREGRHGARSAKQAIAIGLSKARRAGVALRRNRARRPLPRAPGRARPATSPRRRVRASRWRRSGRNRRPRPRTLRWRDTRMRAQAREGR